MLCNTFYNKARQNENRAIMLIDIEGAFAEAGIHVFDICGATHKDKHHTYKDNKQPRSDSRYDYRFLGVFGKINRQPDTMVCVSAVPAALFLFARHIPCS